MNHAGALEIMRRIREGRPLKYGTYEEARAYLDNRQQPVEPRPPLAGIGYPPTMDTPCECGARYGMHRVKDYACPNQEWRPGNGQPQWLSANWKRA